MHTLRKILNYILYTKELRLFNTIYTNFKLFPYKQAIHLPVRIYKKASVTIKGEGMIVLSDSFNLKNHRILIGSSSNDFEFGHEPTSLKLLNGKMIVNGKLEIRKGCLLEIRGCFSAGSDVLFAPHCRLRVHNSVEFGNVVRISHETQIFDSNFHYIEKVGSPGYIPISRPIVIGSRVWVGNRCTINPGSLIPDDTIIASNSLVNKSFSDLDAYSIIGGIPAKKIKDGYSRVWNNIRELEYHLKEFPWRKK